MKLIILVLIIFILCCLIKVKENYYPRPLATRKTKNMRYDIRRLHVGPFLQQLFPFWWNSPNNPYQVYHLI